MKYQKLKEILKNKVAPIDYSIKGNFTGLQYGDIKLEKNINKILICVDITVDSIYFALKNKVNLIISHHPIFPGKISHFRHLLINKLNLLSKYPISIYILNSPFISSENGISETIAQTLYLKIDKLFKIKEKNRKIPVGRICRPLELTESNQDFTLKNLLERVRRNLNKSNVSYVGELSKKIETLCVVGGDTKENKYIIKAVKMGCDCYISSNINHYLATLAQELGLCIVNISHHNAEMLALKKLRNLLSLEFPHDDFLIFDSDDPLKIF
ncbi:MAG: putative GTP cyclohydrolase 1 type 2 [Promethearchaeota archaeon]|nr:MAG: putative GTP cyclohydrolase 1 type 2 [Candidatus Lokiarchaeota archaeon]